MTDQQQKPEVYLWCAPTKVLKMYPGHASVEACEICDQPIWVSKLGYELALQKGRVFNVCTDCKHALDDPSLEGLESPERPHFFRKDAVANQDAEAPMLPALAQDPVVQTKIVDQEHDDIYDYWGHWKHSTFSYLTLDEIIAEAMARCGQAEIPQAVQA